MTVDVQELAARLAERLKVPSVRLTPVDVRCRWPVFRGTADGLPEMFVKVAERGRAARTLAFLSAMRGVPFLPQLVLTEALDFAEHVVLCLEWKSTRCVAPEDMSEVEFVSFAEGCRRLADAFGDYGGPVVPETEDSPDRQYAVLVGYAGRHPLAGRLLRPLLSLPAAARSYGTRPLRVIHGDFQHRNFGFDGDRLAAVFDFDALTRGLPCEDATYAFAERVRRKDLRAAARRRLVDRFLRLVQQSPWPKDEWRIALNHARLRIAARRIGRHPDALFVAVDVWHRDRPLLRLAEALEAFRA